MAPTHDLAIYSPASAPLYAGSLAGGGAERQMFLLARALAAHGLSVCHVVSSAIDLPTRSDGVELVVLEDERRGSPPGAMLRRVMRALAACDARVYLQRSAGFSTMLVGAFARMHRRAFIYSTSSQLDLSHQLPHARIEAVGFRLGLPLADAVVVQTREQAATVAADARVVHIPSLCEPAPFHEAAVRDAFLWVGRAAPYKNPRAFVDLARAVSEARFVMVGVDREARTWLRQGDGASGESIPENLELLGPVSRADLPGLYARAVAVVNTSDFEGFPNTLLEGWAQGALALSLNIDPDDVIARHDLGAVANGSAEALADAARMMWRTRGRFAAQRDAAERYVAEHHGPDALAARWAELIDRLSGQRGLRDATLSVTRG